MSPTCTTALSVGGDLNKLHIEKHKFIECQIFAEVIVLFVQDGFYIVLKIEMSYSVCLH